MIKNIRPLPVTKETLMPLVLAAVAAVRRCCAHAGTVEADHGRSEGTATALGAPLRKSHECSQHRNVPRSGSRRRTDVRARRVRRRGRIGPLPARRDGVVHRRRAGAGDVRHAPQRHQLRRLGRWQRARADRRIDDPRGRCEVGGLWPHAALAACDRSGREVELCDEHHDFGRHDGRVRRRARRVRPVVGRSPSISRTVKAGSATSC